MPSGMKNKNISILSTRPISEALINEAGAKGIQVDVLSFIETITIDTEELKECIYEYSKQACVVIFTSMNAVEAVTAQLHSKIPQWKIFCMGNTTKNLVENYFGNNAIVSTASNATDLADEVIEWNKQQANTPSVVFFCGHQRRDELPGKLKGVNIEVKEIVTYKTIETPHTINKNYDGILFFSPSAVNSFFANNKANENTVLFAIGETTANTIKGYCNNKIVISKTPAKDELLKQAIELLND